jgi:hypothetical protein
MVWRIPKLKYHNLHCLVYEVANFFIEPIIACLPAALIGISVYIAPETSNLSTDLIVGKADPLDPGRIIVCIAFLIVYLVGILGKYKPTDRVGYSTPVSEEGTVGRGRIMEGGLLQEQDSS